MGNAFLVRRAEVADVTSGGIYMIQDAKETLHYGEVVGKGPDCPDVPHVGDLVFFSSGSFPMELWNEEGARTGQTLAVVVAEIARAWIPRPPKKVFDRMMNPTGVGVDRKAERKAAKKVLAT
jgi:hypothetical protein